MASFGMDHTIKTFRNSREAEVAGVEAARMALGPDRFTNGSEKEAPMGWVALLLILALLLGGIGLFVQGLKWMLIIALILFLVGVLTGYRGRRTRP